MVDDELPWGPSSCLGCARRVRLAYIWRLCSLCTAPNLHMHGHMGRGVFYMQTTTPFCFALLQKSGDDSLNGHLRFLQGYRPLTTASGQSVTCLSLRRMRLTLVLRFNVPTCTWPIFSIHNTVSTVSDNFRNIKYAIRQHASP